MFAESQSNENAKLYIGNLPYSVDDSILFQFFEDVLGKGSVKTAQVIIDKYKNRSKGFGFVALASEEYIVKALELNGQEIKGKDGNARPISIDKARERTEREDRPRNYRGSGFGGGGAGRPHSFSPPSERFSQSFGDNNGGNWSGKENNNNRKRKSNGGGREKRYENNRDDNW